MEKTILTTEEKILLTSGMGPWHTNEVADIPSIMMCDGPHGLRKQKDDADSINDSVSATCFPTACAVASSWNPENAANIAHCIAQEAIVQNVSVVLGPGINIKRSPLCGRNFEYFSEDPTLAGHLAAAYVSAMQKNGIGSCLKHFAVNSQETRRMTVDAIVDERALREIYLAAFEYVVKNSSPYCIMASYNKINGSSATENKHLLTEILRGEWHYDGVVMSDWGASFNTPKAIDAGMDLEMPEDKSGYHRALVQKAVESGDLSEEALDLACEHVSNLVFKCINAAKRSELDLQKHHDICRQVAADSAVLLKNDNLLPIDAKGDYCVIGELAEKPRYQGAGSSHINTYCKSFLEVLEDYGLKVNYAKGYLVNTAEPSQKLEAEALKLAQQHKTVLFFGGLTDIFEGEGYDRQTLEIPQNQQLLLQKLHQAGCRIVFVAFAGSPFVMPWLDQTDCLLHMYLGGEAVMEGVFDIVFGLVSPSGRLAETYPLCLQDTPCYNYFANDVHFDEHRESIFVGYRYYNTFNKPVLFPFGYGLSYAQFAYSNFTVKQNGSTFDVGVTVENLSDKKAAEVVQLYVDNPQGNFVRAKRELRAFAKVYLQPHESKVVNLTLSERDFSVYHNGKFVAVNGNYAISLCKNVEEVIYSKQVSINFGEDIAQNDRQNYPDYFSQSQDTFIVTDEVFYKYANWQKPQIKEPVRGEFTLLNTLEDMLPHVGLARTIRRLSKFIAKQQAPTKSPDDPVARMITCGAMETPLISMMSVAGINAKYVKYLLYHANRKHKLALRALSGKYQID